MNSAAAHLSRLLESPALGGERLGRLRAAHVAIAGVGVVGAQAAEHLARLGVRLTLIDRGRVEPHNLANQSYGRGAAGKPKVEALARFLRQRVPGCRVHAVHADVARLGWGFLCGCDAIVTALDNWADRIRLREFAFYAGAPLVDPAVDGSGRAALVRCAVYGPASPEQACLCCRFDARGLDEVRRAGQPASCSTRPGAVSPEAPPTLATSAVGGLAAALAALAVPRLVLGEAQDWMGREVLLDMDRFTLRSHRLAPNARCLFRHERVAPVTAGRRVTLRAGSTLAAGAELLGGPAACLHLQGRSLVTHMACDACGAEREPLRLWESMDEAELRCGCGGTFRPTAGGLVDRIDAGCSGAILQSTWASLGLMKRDIVLASRDGTAARAALLIE